jgi:3-deoxy-D-manno-octulosonate 8-phosphate phosphatase (KDO 8-P phosphatase)
MPASLAPEDLSERLRAIRLLVLDVDGVLTDGVIAIDDRGVETKHFHVRDGSAIALWRQSGRRAAILSGRSAACVDRRAAELGISPVIQGVPSKLEPFLAILEELSVPADQTCYVGDDWADLTVLSLAGLAACPSDAAEEVRETAHVVANSPGGRGAVREVIERILKEQGNYDELIAAYRPTG